MAKQAQAVNIQKPSVIDGVQVLPTPQVGDIVQYAARDNNINDVVAALVTKVEAPGQVQCRVYSPGRLPYYQGGVNWAGNDRRLAPGRPFRSKGVWMFVTPVKDHKQYHREILVARKEAREQIEAQRVAEAERVLKQHENAKSETVSK